jgi:hypothetical protein
VIATKFGIVRAPDTIRRAHAVRPVSAVETEWSVWSRDIEAEVAAAGLTLTTAQIARLGAVAVQGERESDLSHNWFSGVTPRRPRSRGTFRRRHMMLASNVHRFVASG